MLTKNFIHTFFTRRYIYIYCRKACALIHYVLNGKMYTKIVNTNYIHAHATTFVMMSQQLANYIDIGINQNCKGVAIHLTMLIYTKRHHFKWHISLEIPLFSPCEFYCAQHVSSHESRPLPQPFVCICLSASAFLLAFSTELSPLPPSEPVVSSANSDKRRNRLSVRL